MKVTTNGSYDFKYLTMIKSYHGKKTIAPYYIRFDLHICLTNFRYYDNLSLGTSRTLS